MGNKAEKNKKWSVAKKKFRLSNSVQHMGRSDNENDDNRKKSAHERGRGYRNVLTFSFTPYWGELSLI